MQWRCPCVQGSADGICQRPISHADWQLVPTQRAARLPCPTAMLAARSAAAQRAALAGEPLVAAKLPTAEVVQRAVAVAVPTAACPAGRGAGMVELAATELADTEEGVQRLQRAGVAARRLLEARRAAQQAQQEEEETAAATVRIWPLVGGEPISLLQ